MKKIFIVGLVMFSMIFLAQICRAAPFLSCDHQDGVDSYTLEFPAINFKTNVPVDSNGDLMWDLSTWDKGHGWFDATAKACADYQVEDGATGNVTTATKCSDPASLRIKFPNTHSAGNFMLQE